jgi:predicted nucleotidyltransferase component of viral defense system
LSEFDKKELSKQAAELGFIRDAFEKMSRLTGVLAFFERDPVLSQYLALKGGTAINLTIFNLPRLSVDIDLDFAENLPLDEMMAVRETIRTTIRQFMIMNGYTRSEKSKEYHTLDSDIHQFINTGGVRDNIKIEINYSLRSHILPIYKRPIETLGIFEPIKVLVLDPLEIFASKISALHSRAAARDLYDAHNMVYFGLFDESQTEMLRKCVVFYTAISSEETPLSFDFSKMDALKFHDIRTKLVPMLRKKERFDLDAAKSRVREYLTALLNLTDNERQFLSAFANGEFRPELLFNGEELARVANHPMALWKMQNRKQ